MAALTGPRAASKDTLKFKVFKLAGLSTAYRGGEAAADTSSGCVRPATSNNANLINIGQFAEDVSTSGSTATGFVNVELSREIDCYWYDNATGANKITTSNIFSTCYMLDDHTVTLSTGTGSAAAGRIWDVDAIYGVLVQPNGF